VGAAGLRLRFDAPNGPATVTGLRLTLVGGARVEPFPDGKRAALAFSFDWESAMGGLIHSRSAGGEGEGATVGLRADGGPSVAEAEARGLRMREGARALAALFARYGIRGTFYSTGYNLLPGNPGCQKFLGDPLYRNANQSNGWGSDWWRTHPWYGDDPCTTEEQAPAWYFASETRALAAAGHEIASHSFGHLYVRGVKPEELRADLELWNSAVRALGLPPARSFAFPWTSSNSLDETFWVVFEQVGMTILTRVYGPDVRHPYELARVKDAPNLIVFPDFYLASNAAALDEALARIDLTVASRGYHSLWNHPNETLEQQGQVVWQRAVDYAASQRERGLWIAPVSEIVEYGEAARRVNVTVLPLAGGTRLIVENRSGQRLEGITLGLPTAGTVAINGQTQGSTAAQTVILPALEPGAVVTVEVMR
jgi:peptidoglycan/xylan/chitin deacetylase (PgdA/CDA1 family)